MCVYYQYNEQSAVLQSSSANRTIMSVILVKQAITKEQQCSGCSGIYMYTMTSNHALTLAGNMH